ncbi:MAG: isoprenylcysteine carboxylmethyltransferase family protein [Parvularculaceae bacterium]|nr:isoprenylcysteine carboxylmethyltransferase family protein [Parvularculaceae bacterium]
MMDQASLRAVTAVIVITLMAWMAFRNVTLRRQGVKVNLTGQKGNRKQIVLLSGAIVLFAYLLARWPFPVIDDWVRAAPSPSPVAAITVLVLSGLLMAAAQAGMGKNWRVGVPADKGEGDVEALVTGGLHRYSRNPIYLAIMIFIIGAALSAPGPLTIAAIVISFIGLTAIIRSEEDYLRARFGEEFEIYARRVRRWI